MREQLHKWEDIHKIEKFVGDGGIIDQEKALHLNQKELGKHRGAPKKFKQNKTYIKEPSPPHYSTAKSLHSVPPPNPSIWLPIT